MAVTISPSSPAVTLPLPHEDGGLEADVSAYAGLVQISGGTTSAISSSGTGNVVRTTAPTINNATVNTPDIKDLKLRDSDSSHTYDFVPGNLAGTQDVNIPVITATATMPLVSATPTDTGVFIASGTGGLIKTATGLTVSSTSLVFQPGTTAANITVEGTAQGNLRVKDGTRIAYVAANSSLIKIGSDSAHAVRIVYNNGTSCAEFDGSATATHTRLLLWDVDSGQLERVKAGANGSGSISAHRMLQIADV